MVVEAAVAVAIVVVSLVGAVVAAKAETTGIPKVGTALTLAMLGTSAASQRIWLTGTTVADSCAHQFVGDELTLRPQSGPPYGVMSLAHAVKCGAATGTELWPWWPLCLPPRLLCGN